MNVARSRWAPWAGLVAGAFGWSLHQQFLSDVLHFDCRAGGATLGAIACAAVVVLIGAGAWASFGAARADAALPARRFIAQVSVFAAALFLMAVLLQTLATLILPGCGA